MAHKRIHHGDVINLLQREGFSSSADKDAQVLFRHTSGASLILRTQRTTAPASPMELALLRHTMVNFDFMTESEFDRWIADPKHFQAA